MPPYKNISWFSEKRQAKPDVPFFGPVGPNIQFHFADLIRSPYIHYPLNKWVPSFIFPGRLCAYDLNACSSESITGLRCHENVAVADYAHFNAYAACSSLVLIIVSEFNSIPISASCPGPIRLSGVACERQDRDLEFCVQNREVLGLVNSC